MTCSLHWFRWKLFFERIWGWKVRSWKISVQVGKNRTKLESFSSIFQVNFIIFNFISHFINSARAFHSILSNFMLSIQLETFQLHDLSNKLSNYTFPFFIWIQQKTIQKCVSKCYLLGFDYAGVQEGFLFELQI